MLNIPEVLQKLIHRHFTPKVKRLKTGNIIFDKNFEVFASSVKFTKQSSYRHCNAKHYGIK